MKKYTDIVRDCPFCGSPAILLESEPDDEITKHQMINPEGGPVYFVRCTGCGIRTPYSTAGCVILPEKRHITAEDAKWYVINKWNRRKGEP